MSEEAAQLGDPLQTGQLAFCGKWPYFTLNKYYKKLEAAAKAMKNGRLYSEKILTENQDLGAIGP